MIPDLEKVSEKQYINREIAVRIRPQCYAESTKGDANARALRLDRDLSRQLADRRFMSQRKGRFQRLVLRSFRARIQQFQAYLQETPVSASPFLP